MALTYTPIATTTISSSTASVTFSSIPSTYTDLIIISGSLLQVSGSNGLRIRFNSDSGTNYSYVQLVGNGTTASSNRTSNDTSGYAGGSAYSTTNPGTAICHILNYANTTTYKSFIERGAQAGNDTTITSSLWRSTTAINSITLALGGSFPSNNIASGTFTLYGVKAA